jgi:hypothetical protein
MQYTTVVSSQTFTCDKCKKQFLVIEQEEKFLKEKGLPLPVNCHSCRQMRRLQLRGGRQLYRTKCQQCGKDIITSYDPQKATNKILCREDYDKYMSENDPIIQEPLPKS